MKIYFLGIGGVAMGNVAILAQRLGHRISGSDGAVYPPMAEILQRAQISYFEGFAEDNLRAADPDLVVVGNVVSRGNVEVELLLREKKWAYLSLPEFLDHHIIGSRPRIVITGTHGKTTTTALAAYYLRQLSVNCGFFIGGVAKDFPDNGDLGADQSPFVLEGDEYDSAFFDKRSKFIHYRPDILAINRIDFDHADIFRDLADVQRTFRHLLRLVPQNGKIFYCGDDPNIAPLLPVPWTQCHGVGWEKHNDYRMQNFHDSEGGSEWELVTPESHLAIKSRLNGRFNAFNASMAVLIAHGSQGLPLPPAVDLTGFSGVKRRQEILVRQENLIVMEDFAHHPRAVAETLSTLRSVYGDRELIACFESASNTSMRRVLSDDFARAFLLCDRCFLGRPRNLKSIPMAEQFLPKELEGKLHGEIREARSFDSNGGLLSHLLKTIADPTKKFLVVLFSNGAFPEVLDFWHAYHEK